MVKNMTICYAVFV